MVHKISSDEAEVIQRIYREFNEGKSLHKIAKSLNEDKIPTKKNRIGGWNTSTLSRILKNKRYIGIWDWRKYKNVKDPMTGRRKKVLRPKKRTDTYIQKRLNHNK